MKSVVPIGPWHPLQEEPELFRLHVDGETITSIDIEIGWNHKGIEKLAESRTYDQIVFLVERICGICSNSHPIASVQAMEDAGDIEVPERALYIRTIMAELERLHSHLLWLGLGGHVLGYNTVFMWAWRYREPILDLFEKITGNRNHYAMMKPGGVRRDVRPEHTEEVVKYMDDLLPALDLFKGAVLDDPVIHARTKGIGMLTADDVFDYGAFGPTGRASNVPWDVRRDHPYAVYDRIDWDVITHPDCDCFGRLVVRVLEMIESCKIVKQCVQKMPEGPIDSNPTHIAPGEGIGVAEAPRGEVLHYCLSDGTNRPVRYKARAPTFMNLPTQYTAVVGESITDAVLILAAIDPCYCCTERTVAFNGAGERVYSPDGLIRLSQEKTEKLRRELGVGEPEGLL